METLAHPEFDPRTASEPSREPSTHPYGSEVIFTYSGNGEIVYRSISKISTRRPITDEEIETYTRLKLQGSMLAATPLPGNEEKFREVIFRLSQTGYFPIVSIPEKLNNKTWGDLEHYYCPNGASLVTCAREFKAMNPELANPSWAMGACHPVSCDFYRLLIKRGAITYDSDAAVEHWSESRWGDCDGHTVVRVGNIVIDWTYRQYDHNAPFPYVYRLKPGEEIRHHRKVVDWEKEA